MVARLILAILHFWLLSSFLFLAAQENDLFQRADELDWQGLYGEERQLLQAVLANVKNPLQKAEIAWRLSRAILNYTESEHLAGRLTTEQALKAYEEGERYADMAINANPRSPDGYFWKSAQMGMWGQTRGVLDSLFKVAPMHENLRLALKQEPNYADAFYVLGELYEKAPGWPLSIGNIEYAVSLGRKACDLMEEQIRNGKLRFKNYVYYIALASHLWNRNWDFAKRRQMQAELKKKYYEKQDWLEKHFFYEGILELKRISDREEALQLLNMVILELSNLPTRTVGQEKDLKSARDLLKTLQK